jgi:imidazolonepropionase-like amidohydrolase
MLSLLLLAVSCVQNEPPPVAVQGATVVVAPGKTIENATIVLRDGLIESVGADVVPPKDVEVIDGKGLVVYAGFVDAHAKFGIPDTKLTAEQIQLRESERHDFTRDPLFGMQEANRKGLRAELDASQVLAWTDADLKKWQAGGFTAVVCAADDEFVSGTSAIVALNGGARRSAILQPRWGMHASFRSYGEGYPRTIMGALAHLRQYFLDAQAYQKRWDDYLTSPRGKKRPAHDPGLEAILPVLQGRVPFVFEANTENEIGRALSLAAEFKLRLVVTGGAEANRLAAQLKNVPVLLSLKLPKEPKEKKDTDKPKKLIAEEKRLWEERVRCAADLHAAGVRVAFTTSGLSPADALETIEKLLKHGLTREQALASLTTAPAEILGLTEIGTLERGKIANLTVLTAPLGEKKGKVRFVFVDGRKFEFDAKKAGGAPPEIDLNGKWNIVVEPPTKMEAVIEITQDGADLSGRLVTEHGETDVTGSVSGKKFTIQGSFHGSEFTVEGELKSGKLSGKVKTMMGESEFTGSKPEDHDD